MTQLTNDIVGAYVYMTAHILMYLNAAILPSGLWHPQSNSEVAALRAAPQISEHTGRVIEPVANVCNANEAAFFSFDDLIESVKLWMNNEHPYVTVIR